jgi:RNA recognition motif-containing protein
VCYTWSVTETIEVKLIRDKVTGYLSGYGFIEFETHEAAAAALERYNGQLVKGTAVRYRLNWGAGGQRIESAPEFSIFVGDLSPEVTDVMLRQTFSAVYPSVLGAKIVTDPASGASKGFGFVRFSNEQERDMAFAMQGSFCAGRPMRVAAATKRLPAPGAP